MRSHRRLPDFASEWSAKTRRAVGRDHRGGQRADARHEVHERFDQGSVEAEEGQRRGRPAERGDGRERSRREDADQVVAGRRRSHHDRHREVRANASAPRLQHGGDQAPDRQVHAVRQADEPHRLARHADLARRESSRQRADPRHAGDGGRPRNGSGIGQAQRQPNDPGRHARGTDRRSAIDPDGRNRRRATELHPAERSDRPEHEARKLGRERSHQVDQ